MSIIVQSAIFCPASHGNTIRKICQIVILQLCDTYRIMERVDFASARNVSRRNKVVFAKFSKLFGSDDDSPDDREIVTRALNVHGLEEYRETTTEVERLKQAIDEAPTRMQKRDHEDLLVRYICRQNALRSAAVVLAKKLDASDSPKIYEDFAITDKDRSKVSSGMTDPHQCPAHELARYFIEEAQNDFVMGRV